MRLASFFRQLEGDVAQLVLEKVGLWPIELAVRVSVIEGRTKRADHVHPWTFIWSQRFRPRPKILIVSDRGELANWFATSTEETK